MKARVTLWPELETTDRVKTTLTASQYFQKGTKIQNVYPSTFAQTLQQYTTLQMELSNVNQQASHGRKETQIVQSQTLEGE